MDDIAEQERAQLETEAAGLGPNSKSVGAARAKIWRQDREYDEEQERSRREFEGERQQVQATATREVAAQQSRLGKLMLATAVASAIAAILSVAVTGVAGWASVGAANRQEQATYQSQLYNKQVDTIGVLIRSALDNAQKLDEEYKHYLAIRPTEKDISPALVDDIRIREVNTANQFFKDYQVTWLVVPHEIKGKLNDLMKTMTDFLDKVTEAETPGNADLTEEERQDMWKQVSNLAITLGDCASGQFSSGLPLKGGQFMECFEN